MADNNIHLLGAKVVYQINQIMITRDLVFGWCYTTEDRQRDWNPVSSAPTLALKTLRSISWPTYVPEDFMSAVNEELMRRQASENIITAANAAATLKKKEKSEEQLKLAKATLQRSQERHQLISGLMKNINITGDGGVVCFSETYVNVLKLPDNRWAVIGTMTDVRESFGSFDEAIDFILKKYW